MEFPYRMPARPPVAPTEVSALLLVVSAEKGQPTGGGQSQREALAAKSEALATCDGLFTVASNGVGVHSSSLQREILSLTLHEVFIVHRVNRALALHAYDVVDEARAVKTVGIPT